MKGKYEEEIRVFKDVDWLHISCLCGFVTQNTKRNSTELLLVTHKTQKESRLRVGHAGDVCQFV
jgi:hypothetical protein